jgi:hypothetical protein
MRNDLPLEIGHREAHVGAADIGDQGRGIAQNGTLSSRAVAGGGNLAASAALSKRKRAGANRFH